MPQNPCPRNKETWEMKYAEKAWYIGILKERYRRGKKNQKGRILDEACGLLSLSRRQARRLLSPGEVGRPKKSGKGGRPGRYQDREFKDSLKIIWRITHYMCSRHLKAALPHWLPFIEQERGEFKQDVRERLLQVSAATIDRILKEHKALKGKGFTRNGGFRDEIPIQKNVWDIKVPGFLETDTVAHCGGTMSGEFINSVVMVDIASIWTEARAVFGRGSTAVVEAIEDIENTLPFEILGYDSDNGTEVLNRHILRYFKEERIERNRPPVQVTRSREYKKNDNAHVEQRNDSVARRWLGYERLEFKELVPLINYYYAEIVCPMMNHFFPSFKLQDKIRIKSRTRRVYQDPVTPYSRVMSSDDVPEARKAQLAIIHNNLNPVELMKQERLIRRRIDTALKRLRGGQLAGSLLKVNTST